MRNITITSVVLFLALAGAVYCATVVYDESSYTSSERRWQPVPTGHQAGRDSGTGTGTHHPGEDCGICHRPGAKAANMVFVMAGTLYENRLGIKPVEGGEIILQDYNGNIVSMTTNSVGNFWTTRSLASYPYSLLTSHGHAPFTPLYTLDNSGQLLTPPDPNNSATWKYKAWVKNGARVMPMMSIAGVGGGPTAPRMGCSMHHASLGSRGALWAGGASTLPDYPATNLGYRKHIFPILRSKCAPCHIPGATQTGLMGKPEFEHEKDATKGVPMLEYSSNLDLMTYEGSSVASPVYNPDTGAVTGSEMITKRGVKAVVDVASPDSSPLLVKTAGNISHGGGAFWSSQDPDYRAIRQWIAEGAIKN